MQPKKLQKEKAPIFHQKIMTDSNSYNFKYSGSNMIYTSHQNNDFGQINFESKNMKQKDIKYDNNKNLEFDEYNNSNYNENTSSNKDDKRFCSSQESQGNTNNSSNEKKKEEIKEGKINKFNISKYNNYNKKKDNLEKNESFLKKPRKKKELKDKDKHKENKNNDSYEKLTTTLIFQSSDNNYKNNLESNSLAHFENKFEHLNLNEKNINNKMQIDNNNYINYNTNIKKQTFNIMNNQEISKNNETIYKFGEKGVNFKSRSCEKYSMSQFNVCKLFKTITLEDKNESPKRVALSPTNSPLKKFNNLVSAKVEKYEVLQSIRKFDICLMESKTNEVNYIYNISNNTNNNNIKFINDIMTNSNIKINNINNNNNNIKNDNIYSNINDINKIDKSFIDHFFNIKTEKDNNLRIKLEETRPKKNHKINLEGRGRRKKKEKEKVLNINNFDNQKEKKYLRKKEIDIVEEEDIDIVDDFDKRKNTFYNNNNSAIQIVEDKLVINGHDKSKSKKSSSIITINSVINIPDNNDDEMKKYKNSESILTKKDNIFILDSNDKIKEDYNNNFMNNYEGNNSDYTINIDNINNKDNNNKNTNNNDKNNILNNNDINLINNNESNNIFKNNNINYESYSLNNFKNINNNENNNSFNIGNNLSNINLVNNASSEDNLIMLKNNNVLPSHDNSNSLIFNNYNNNSIINHENSNNNYNHIFKNDINGLNSENIKDIFNNNNKNNTNSNDSNILNQDNNNKEVCNNKENIILNNDNINENNNKDNINNKEKFINIEKSNINNNYNNNVNIQNSHPNINKEDKDDIEMKDETNIIYQNDNKKIANEPIKINEDVEMKDSKEESNNNASINNTENSHHTISLGKPPKQKVKSKTEQIYQTITDHDEKEEEEEVIPPPKISDFLPCREREQEIIYKYIKTGLYTKGNYSSLYISGMPGTGKTDSVKRVIEILENQFKQYSKNQNKFLKIYINGIEFLHPKKVFKRIYENIFTKKKKLFSIIKALDEFFRCRNDYNSSIYLKNPNNCHIILILDEVDLLIDKSQTLLYNIFNWTTYPQSKLIVLSISNTLDLPNRLFPKVQSRMGNNKIMFKPYTKDELHTIILSRGININTYSEDALKLSSMKVAAVNGDLRRIIQILNKSKEIYEEEKRNFPNASNVDLITKYHILKACEELFDSKITKVLRMLQISEKIILAALLTKIKDNNESKINVAEIYERKDKFLEKYNEACSLDLNISWYEFQRIIYNLLRLKIISFFDGQRDNFIDNYVVIKFYSDEFMAACDGNESMKPVIDLINNLLGNYNNN